MVTHDATAACYADAVLFLADGRIVGNMEHPSVPAKIAGANAGLSVVDPATAGEVFDLQQRADSIEALDETGILVSKKKADDAHLSLGSTVTVTFLGGVTHTLTVQGIYDKDELAGACTITKSLYATTGSDQYDFSVFVKRAGGANAGTVEHELRAAVAPYPTAKLESRSAYIESQASQIDTFVNLVYGLLALP
jgi:putative ABC transport system permease protein